DLVAEHGVHHLVLLNARLPLEGGGDHDRAEVVAAAGPVLDLRLGAGDRGLDALLDLVRSGHPANSVASAILFEATPVARRRKAANPTMILITDKGAEKVHEFLASQNADVQTAGL